MIFLGCNLSPLLFALFIGDLGRELNSTSCGLPLGDMIISCLKFADDIVLIAKSKKDLETLMKITRKCLKELKLEISVSKSKIMMFDARTGKMSFNSAGMEPICLEKVVCFKY